ncbi:MAG: diacylglycerol kinase family protein [Solirubrobacteraceae bacterium]
MKIALVANPASGSAPPVEELVRDLSASGAQVEPFTLDEADAAASSGADRVVVAGGDGSVGTVFAACAAHGVPLALLPAGTANDFAAAMEVPGTVADALPLAADPDAPHRPAWGGWIDDHPFVNVASIGLGVYAAEAAAPMKPMLGPVAYAVGALRAAVAGRATYARVIVDGEEVFAGDVWQILVGASGAFGGGAQLPVSDPDTPELEAFVLPAGHRLSLVRRAWGMRHGGRRGGVSVFQGHEIVVDQDPDRQWNVDGDVRDLGDVTVRPLGPVEMIVPADGKDRS